MDSLRSNFPRKLPNWLVVAGSLALGAHLLALLALVLSAPSGTWQTPYGPGMADPPRFASEAARWTTDRYLKFLRLDNNYHFDSNRVRNPAVYFVVELRDREGNTIKKVKIPEDGANPWVKHRQVLLAQGLGQDQNFQPQPGEKIPAPGEVVPKVTYWEMKTDAPWKLMSEEQHLLVNKGPLVRPSKWSLLLARAYMRYLCRKYDAASAELVRHHRDAVGPEWLFVAPPASTFDEGIASFGEYRREQ